MVCEWGMSDKLGPVAISKKQENIFLGREIHESREISQKTAELVDSEVHRIIKENYDRGTEIIEKNMDVLTRMAEALLEREVLDESQVSLIMEGKPLPPVEEEDSTAAKKEAEPKKTPSGEPESEVA